MSLAVVLCRGQEGVHAPEIRVEVHVAPGLPSLTLVGLPETAVRESKDRVRAALLNAGFEFPARRITINLAPADLPKEGSRFDLAIALGILAATGQVPSEALAEKEFLAELALDGSLRPVSGVLTAAIAARNAGRILLVSGENAAEAARVSDAHVLQAEHLLQVSAFLRGREELARAEEAHHETLEPFPCLSEVRGQQLAKRALEIAASGHHNLLFHGPPGTGKSMLASRLPGILPAMNEVEAIETSAVYSISGLAEGSWLKRPYRAPHHTASAVALVGGGSKANPGEISLAHNGVLFLDELPEFDRRVLEVLREPMESGHIAISRAARQVTYPARFQLLAAMNPCPCGYHGDPKKACTCSAFQIHRYRNRVSGPMLDRIDMILEMARPSFGEISGQSTESGEKSTAIRDRVSTVHQLQYKRQGILNGQLSTRQTEQFCVLDQQAMTMLEKAMESLALSSRSYHRILKLSRTIADMAGEENIKPEYVAEALSYHRGWPGQNI